MPARSSALVLAAIVCMPFLMSPLLPGDIACAETLFSEDWEGGIGNWYVTNGLWEVGGPTVGPSGAHSGGNCAGTVLAGNYPNYANTRLVSPRVTLPDLSGGDRIWLKFWQWFATENGYDKGWVQISTDNGITWGTVSDPQYDGYGMVWTQACVDLSSYAGSAVRIGFLFQSDGVNCAYAGWYVDDVSVQVGQFALALSQLEDFELGVGDWGADNGLWEVGAPTAGPWGAHSGSNCMGTVLSGSYPNNANTRLISPRVALPELSGGDRVWLKFWQWFATENGYDRGLVQVSTDNGVTWEYVSDPQYDGYGVVWTQACIDLSAYAGSTVRIGFLFLSDGVNCGYEGWYIDDVSVHVGQFTFAASQPEDFELGVGDWGADNGLWEVGAPTAGPAGAHSGSNCAGTVLGGNYPNNANTRLVSPWITLEPEPGELPELFFWHWFNTEPGWDKGWVQVRVRGTGDWQTVQAPGSPFSGNGGAWTQGYADLSAYVGQTVRIGFYLTSDGTNCGYTGWYIDDVRIEGVQSPVEGVFYASLTESGSVVLRWTIASLSGLESLDIYRATSPDGPFARVNDEPIPLSSPGSYEDTSVWPETTFWYELRAHLANGGEDTVGASMATVTTDGRLALRLWEPAPNPLRDATTIQFDIPDDAVRATLVVYDAAGRVVRTLADAPAERGRHVVGWDGRDSSGAVTASGIYFLRLAVDGRSETVKAVVVR